MNYRTWRLRVGSGGRRPLTVEARLLSRHSLFGICGGRSGTGTGPPPPHLYGIPQSVSFLHSHLYLNTAVIRRYRRSLGNFKQNSAVYDMGRTLEKMWYYLLSPRCRVLLEKLTGLHLVKKFPTFHGTRRFIIAPTSVRENVILHSLFRIQRISLKSVDRMWWQMHAESQNCLRKRVSSRGGHWW